MDSDLKKYSEIKNITADLCMVIKLHRLITVEYKNASSIYKFCHSKIRRGIGKVQEKANFTLEQTIKAQSGRRGIALIFL